MKPEVRYLSNLTPLRGIAALLVAVFHFEMAVARFIPASQTMFFEKSYLMVDLFFIMSGFIMFHVYGHTFESPLSAKPFRQFLVARFARIYPLHFFSLVLLILLVAVLPAADLQYRPVEDRGTLLSNFLLLHTFYLNKIYTWNIPSWSISAEWWCYLLFPAAVWLHYKKKVASIVLFLVLIVCIYYSIMYLLPRKNPLYPSIPVPHNINSTYDYGFLRGLAGFLLGMLMYFLYQAPSCQKIFQRDWYAIPVLLLLILAMHYALNDVYCVLLFAALIPGFASNNATIHRVCKLGILQYIGDISYSIYMMQIFLQVPFSHGFRLPGVTGFGRGKLNIASGSGLIYCGIYLLLLVAMASLTYYGIEKPCRRFINRKWGGS